MTSFIHITIRLHVVYVKEQEDDLSLRVVEEANSLRLSLVDTGNQHWFLIIIYVLTGQQD
jgi:hypothetical protein